MSPLLGILSSGGLAPGAPTIGTATDGGTGTSASVTFTAPSYVGKGSGTVTYTATSSPGSLTGTATSSPVTVSGLTSGTAYTFTVKATTSYGVTGASSAASNSVTPANPSSYESIASTTGGGAYSITFSSIPTGYKSLQVRFSFQNASNNGDWLFMQFNGDTAGNYDYHRLRGNGATVFAGRTNNASYMFASETANGAWPSYPGIGIIDVIDYDSTTKNKTMRHISGSEKNGAGGIELGSGLWRSTAAVTSITLTCFSGSGSFTSSSFALYGIKG